MTTIASMDFRDAVLAAATRPGVVAAVDAVYADVANSISARQPRCAVSGKCCHFEKYGHRLYLSTLEMAAFVAKLGSFSTSEITTGCPFQIDKLCSVHAIRPFGCRMFFCDPTATDWQQEQYEIFHTRLGQLHRELNVDYFYVEWRHALRTVLAPPVPAPVMSGES